MNLFAFVSSPSVVWRLVSEPNGTISFSLSKQLRKWALLVNGATNDDDNERQRAGEWRKTDTRKRYKDEKYCWQIKIAWTLLRIKEWWQNCIFRAQNKHFSSPGFPSFSRFFFFFFFFFLFLLHFVSFCVVRSEENFRLNYLSIIELHLVCVMYTALRGSA